MRITILKLLIVILCCQSAQAINVGKGRISLIDLGSRIKSEAKVANSNYINVYTLSGQIDKEDKSILAIQGLADQGHTSFFIDTYSGVKNFDVHLDKSSSELEVLRPKYQRSKILGKDFKLNINSALRVASPFYINDVVLAGNPSLFKLDPFSGYYDENFLKNFILNAKDQKAKTDIVVPTTHNVFKFSLEIQDLKGAYDNAIDLI